MRIPSAQTSKPRRAPSSIAAPGTNIPAAKAEELKANLGNLRHKVEGFDRAQLSAADRFRQDAFGDSAKGAGNGAINELGRLREMGGGHSRNPLDGALTRDFTGGGRGHVSDEPAKEEFSWGTFFGSVVEGVIGIFAPRGAPTGLLTGPGTVQTVTGDPADLLNGVKAVGQSGDKDPRMKAILDDMDKEPTPDDTGGKAVVTAQDIRGIAARRGAKGEPVNDGDGTGSGGPTAVPKTAQQGEWANDGGAASAVVNEIQLKGLEARINARITIIR